jgi:hypothetical protein
MAKKISVGIKSALIGACALVIVALIQFFHHSTPISSQSANNSPGAILQSATASGNNSTVIQAGSNSVINYGVSEATVREILKQKEIEVNEKLALKYPQGYILFGIASGKIIYEPRFREIIISADWDNTTIKFAPGNHYLVISIPDLTLQMPGYSISPNPGQHSLIQLSFPFIENEPKEILSMIPPLAGRAFIEVLDTSEKIFIIGFK